MLYFPIVRFFPNCKILPIIGLSVREQLNDRSLLVQISNLLNGILVKNGGNAPNIECENNFILKMRISL